MKKICTCCREEKELELFTKDIYTVSGYKSHCKKCCSIKTKNWTDKNKERVKQYNKKWREENKKYFGDYQKYIKGNLKDFKLRGRENLGRSREEARLFVKENKSEYDKRNREKINEYNRNVDRRKKKYKYRSKRAKEDPNYKIRQIMRSRLGMALRDQGVKKHKNSKDYIGCTYDELIKYLESLFSPGMNWKNHGYGMGKWHVDHIIACSRFDLTKIEEQNKCFNYKNLQPMWHQENLLKGDKIIQLIEGIDFEI